MNTPADQADAEMKDDSIYMSLDKQWTLPRAIEQVVVGVGDMVTRANPRQEQLQSPQAGETVDHKLTHTKSIMFTRAHPRQEQLQPPQAGETVDHKCIGRTQHHDHQSCPQAGETLDPKCIDKTYESPSSRRGDRGGRRRRRRRRRRTKRSCGCARTLLLASISLHPHHVCTPPLT
jgi:hypothetical protein